MVENRVIPKASLWIGNHDIVSANIISYLQKLYCKINCKKCSVCKQIEIKQFYDVHWTTNDGIYKIEDFNIIEHILMYKRDTTNPFFFIIPHADFLSLACANKLLKSLEDSTQGYHFILIASGESNVLPTIASRCFLYHIQKIRPKNNLSSGSATTKNISLFDFFTSAETCSLKQYNELIDLYKNKSESEILSLCNQLLEYWIDVYKNAPTIEKRQKALDRTLFLEKLITCGIPHGSFILIFRTLYLQWNITP